MKEVHHAHVVLQGHDDVRFALERIAVVFNAPLMVVVRQIEDMESYVVAADFNNKYDARVFVLVARPDKRGDDVDACIVVREGFVVPYLEPEEATALRSILRFHADDEPNEYYPFAVYKSLCAKFGVTIPG